MNETNISNANTKDDGTTSWDPFTRTMLIIILVPTFVIFLQVLTARARTTSNPNSNNSKTFNHQGRRRIQHALTGLSFYILSFLLTHFIACLLLSTTTTLFYVLHLLRSKSKTIQQFYIQQFGPLLRDHEKNIHTAPGAFWFLLGTTVLVISFSMDIVRTSLLCLSFGDPIASAMGIRFGGPKIQLRHGNKSLVGCCACFITCVTMSALCMGIKYGQGVWILTGLIATLMEVLSGLIGVDDNILIPLGTGITLSLYLTSKGFTGHSLLN
jgi:dolichol kinase